MQSLNFAPLIYHWYKAGGSTGAIFGDWKFDLIFTKYIRVSVPSLSRIFLPTSQITRDHWALLLSGKAVVPPIKITFKRIDSAKLKLTLSCLKSIVVWNTYAIESRVVNGPTRSSPNPARTRKCKPEPGPNPKIIKNCKWARKSPNNCLQISNQFNAKFCSILLLETLLYGLQLWNTKLVYIE